MTDAWEALGGPTVHVMPTDDIYPHVPTQPLASASDRCSGGSQPEIQQKGRRMPELEVNQWIGTVQTGLATHTSVDLPKCSWCGGFHSTTCPRVRALEYHPNGALKRVEFISDERKTDG